MNNIAEILIDHYQKTYELTYMMWKQRNRLFILLIIIIGVATLLTFRVSEANSLLVDLIAKIFSITDQKRIDQLRTSFPFGVIQSILLITIFFLMVNLYHRALYVLRNYQYLGALEKEIRSHLNLSKASIGFTRESTFYWSRRSSILGSVKWFYIVLLGILLLTFLSGRIIDDFQTGSFLLAIAELIIMIPILLYFFAYANSSIFLDSEDSILNGKNR